MPHIAVEPSSNRSLNCGVTVQKLRSQKRHSRLRLTLFMDLNSEERFFFLKKGDKNRFNGQRTADVVSESHHGGCQCLFVSVRLRADVKTKLHVG